MALSVYHITMIFKPNTFCSTLRSCYHLNKPNFCNFFYWMFSPFLKNSSLYSLPCFGRFWIEYPPLFWKNLKRKLTECLRNYESKVSNIFLSTRSWRAGTSVHSFWLNKKTDIPVFKVRYVGRKISSWRYALAQMIK